GRRLGVQSGVRHEATVEGVAGGASDPLRAVALRVEEDHGAERAVRPLGSPEPFVRPGFHVRLVTPALAASPDAVQGEGSRARRLATPGQARAGGPANPHPARRLGSPPTLE